MKDSPYVRALKLMLEELDYPNRDLRIAAQVMSCKEELNTICKWLYREVERAIDTETMFEDR